MERERLRAIMAERVLLLDGAMGSLLIARGLPAGRAPEWWVLERPETIVEVHRSYVAAGCDIIHTATFGASPPKLAAAGLAGRCREVNSAAARSARQACRPETLVAGDVGPTGLLFPPMGDATEERLREAFSEQVAALAEAGCDLVSIETMYDLREALAATAAAADAGLAVLASMTFDEKRRGFFSLVGDRVAPSLAALASAGAVAVGVNCSLTSDRMLALVKEVRDSGIGASLVVQPNAGQPRPTPSGVVYDASPEAFAADLVEMARLGARMVGGCCGTDAAFIAAARRRLGEVA